MERAEARHELEKLLLSLPAGALWRWLTLTYPGLEREVAWEGATPARRVRDVVVWLDGAGRVDAAFFEGLAGAFEGRAVEVRVLAAAWKRFSAEESPTVDYPTEEARRLDAAIAETKRELEKQALARADTTAIRAQLAALELQFKREMRPGRQLQASDVLSERYRLGERIGSGGFGEVWRAWDRDKKQIVAIKVLHARHSEDRIRRERFFRGARKMANINHQAVVKILQENCIHNKIYYFVMEYIEGGNLHDAVTQETLDLDSAVKIIFNIGEALVALHNAGMIHRDIKPQNILIDKFGSTKLTDFDLVYSADTTGGTGLYPVMGSVFYMAPELLGLDWGQKLDQPSPSADVYSFAVTILFILLGRHFQRTTFFYERKRFFHNIAGSASLKKILYRALSPSPIDRYQNLKEFIDELRNVYNLDELKLTYTDSFTGDSELASTPEVVRELFEASEIAREGFRALLSKANSLERQANEILSRLHPYDSADLKKPAWLCQDTASNLRHQAALEAAIYEQKIQSILQIAPDFEVARVTLAEFYLQRAKQAESTNNIEQLAYYERRLIDCDTNKTHAHWLNGEGTLSLHTTPPNAEVFLFSYVEQERRLIPSNPRFLGSTPLEGVRVPKGSHVLEIKHPEENNNTVRYPIFIRRNSPWDGVPPKQATPHPIHLPTLEELNPKEIYVPAGWFQCGGDVDATDSLSARQIWVDGFVIQKHPITHEEYLLFLNALINQGRIGEAQRHTPCLSPSVSSKLVPLYQQNKDGLLELITGNEFTHRELDWPVSQIDWESACAYATWWSSQTKRPWRLPEDLEWEKAARGVDGRFWPWGNHLEPTWTNMSQSHSGRPSLLAVTTYPTDESPYGVRGMAGNIRDWCNNGYRKNLPPSQDRVVISSCGEDEPYRIGRGGSWTGVPSHCRPAARLVGKPTDRLSALGFRLVYSYPITENVNL